MCCLLLWFFLVFVHLCTRSSWLFPPLHDLNTRAPPISSSLLYFFLGFPTVFPFLTEMTNINPQITSQHTLIRPAVSAQCSTFQIQDKQAMFCCTFRWLTQMCSRCRFYTRSNYEMVSLAFSWHTFAHIILLNFNFKQRTHTCTSYFYLNWN